MSEAEASEYKVAEMDEEAIDYDEPQLLLYVEKSTNYIYEVQFFDGFVLYRPATPGFADAVRKMGSGPFLNHFEEYGGNYDEFYSFVRGESSGLIVT